MSARQRARAPAAEQDRCGRTAVSRTAGKPEQGRQGPASRSGGDIRAGRERAGQDTAKRVKRNGGNTREQNGGATRNQAQRGNPQPRTAKRENRDEVRYGTPGVRDKAKAAGNRDK